MKLNLSTFTKTLTFAVLTFSIAPCALLDQETIERNTKETSVTTPKYVFYFIGDGMGTVHRSAAEFYQNNGAIPNRKKLKMNEFPYYGMSTTFSTNSSITDSAAAGTALASGNKTESGVLNMDPSKTKKFTTLAEVARDAGYHIGIVSSVTINHATPAAFYAHQASRGMYYRIASELSQSGFEYFGGGGPQSLETAPPGAPSTFDLAKERGYTIVTTPEEFDALTPESGKVWAIGKEGAALDYALDADEKDISLAEFTEKGIELLKDNEKGFFMMVEGGKIDWASHANDPGAALNDVIAFDDAIKVAYEFYEEHPEETLIVATADHETGGLTIGFAGTKYTSFPAKISSQKMTHEKLNEMVNKWKEEKPEFKTVVPAIINAMGLKDLSDFELAQLEQAYNLSVHGTLPDGIGDEEKFLLYGPYEPVTVKATHIATRQAGMSWSTYSHTGVPVPVTAVGMGAENFTGYYDNTDIPKKIAEIMEIELPSMKLAASQAKAKQAVKTSPKEKPEVEMMK